MNVREHQSNDDHPLRDPFKAQARHIAENSIVRLPDGRVGYLTHRTGAKKPWVVVKPGHLAVEINRTDTLEVLCCPLQMALAWLATHTDPSTNSPIYQSTNLQEIPNEPPT